MIPGKESTNTPAAQDKVGSFAIFDFEYFIRRLLKNWYWFVLMAALGYGISWVYSKYYAQRIYASNLSLSISNSTASYFTPNQSINFIWGQTGNQDGVYLKKMLLSRSHNEYLVKQLDLYVNYATSGLIKQTYLDKYDSPVFLEIDRSSLQQVEYPITLIPKGGDRYEVVLPKEGQSRSLYSFELEGFKTVPKYVRPENKILALNQWYTSPNLKFKLIKNPQPSEIKFENIIISLSTVNNTVNNLVSTISVEFDKEISTIMMIGKKGYNLNGTVNFLNTSVAELEKKRLIDRNVVDKNTDQYLIDNLGKIRKKLDSSATVLNQMKVSEGLYDIKDRDEKSLENIKALDAKKADFLTRINSLNTIKNSLTSQNLDRMISTNSAGIEDGMFNATVAELKVLYAKRRELALIYTPSSEPMREINRLINEARTNSTGSLGNYYNTYVNEISKIDREIARANIDLVTYPEKERKYMDAERGYNMIEATYNVLLSKQNETQIRVATNKSDINVIDPAKNLGQGPIAPNIAKVKYIIMGGLLLLPLLLLAIGQVLDSRIRNIKELLQATRIPLLGVIGKSTHDNNLTVLEQPRSSISEAFRGIRANLRFLHKEDNQSKVILVTSSIGGEGKTYVSINIASVLGLSGKKTILLGMDLRKPKIFGDFKINNQYGISNYLTGEVEMAQIINKTSIPDLDVATSGPIPPNPSELLMSDRNIAFINELKNHY
ncbi:polysaccharide biosynthesis tyrosine autokinase, partial [Kaistella sp.]